ncbi:MAG TPA: glucoamylase family protein [Steroidobacteraceae bacterium]|jgi:hypothetical protein
MNIRIARLPLVASLAAITVAWLLSACNPLTALKPTPHPKLLEETDTPNEAATFLEDIEHRTFDFFWANANAKNGLVPDRYPTKSFASLAAVGFALTAYPIGVERGYISRTEARDRVLRTLRFFRDAPQGPAAKGFTGYRGFYYHFLDMETGTRFGQSELSMVDTALFIAGVLLCQDYFDGSDPEEKELRKIADWLYRRIDWGWATRDDGVLALGWSPELGFHQRSWRGYNESSIMYILGLGSPTSSMPGTAWLSYTSTFDFHWVNEGEWYLAFPPLFGHQFSHVWIDFRDIRDAYMRGKGIDYFDNTRRAIYAQRSYVIANPMKWEGYSAKLWGITASDGPADAKLEYNGEIRQFHSYAARGAGGPQNYDDGTLAPNAVAGSLPFTPEIAIPTLKLMKEQYGQYIYSTFGFVDAFNMSFKYPDVPLNTGKVIPDFGWVDTDYLGIDQGLTVTMIENFRSGFIWRMMRKSPYIRRGLERAGFQGGWLATGG